MRLIDLTGQRFGRLTVVERAPNRGRTYWTCRCECGADVEASAGNLRSDRTQSCGCDWARPPRYELTGETFGRLTVVERAPDQDGRGKTWWLCHCTCGAERIALGESLRNGRTNSCGTHCVNAIGRRPWPTDSRILAGPDGSIVGPSGRPLTPFTDPDGYLRINVYRAGKWQQVGVHVVVCETFHGPRPGGMHAAHENGIKADCRSANLAWKTPTENEADKVEHDTRAWGERHGMRKLTESDVQEIRTSAEPARVLAARYPVGAPMIRRIRARRSWTHV